MPRPVSDTACAAWRTHILIVLFGAFLVGPITAQTPTREVLNSERIEAAFGNYGIEILSSDGRVRVSNLFTSEHDARTCRTFAVVSYPSQIDGALADEHAAIAAGGSIGAVFTARGWAVHKRHLRYGEVSAPAALAALMNIEPGTALAEHLYVLDVERNGRVFEYAALAEIHHPDYLRAADLAAIYGATEPQGREALVAALLRTAAEHAAAAR